MSVFGEPVSRVRGEASGVDRYGNPTVVDVEVDLPPAAFAPAGAPEVAEPGRVIVSTAPTLYWRGERPDVVASDRLRVRGVVYAVDGAPADWRDPWGSDLGGLVVRLAESAG